jgi:superfamily II DNA or RNA helicase
MKTILTRRGYQINRETIDQKTIDEIKKELKVEPKTSYTNEDLSYSLFSKGKKYIILPRFYGEKKFGIAQKNIIYSKTADITFNGNMRKEQEPIVNKCIDHLKKFGGGMLSLGCGGGKCFAIGTKILMFDGNIKKVEDIVIYDKIMGIDSKVRNVLSLGTGYEEMFEILYDEKYIVNKSHILSLIVIENFDNYQKNDIIDIPIEEYLEDIKYKIYARGFRVSVEFPYIYVDAPYNVYGNFINSKIPKKYIINCREIRLKVLAGIIDLEGEEINNYIRIKVNQHKKEIIYLSRSLGYKIIYDKEYLYINKVNDNLGLIYDFQIKSIGCGKYYGFEIDGDRRFLLEDFTVVHNTVISLYIASQLKAKTLVIVTKTFLLDQWIKRAKEFTNANIGIIRQNIIKVDGYDIVIAMAQSLSMRDYDLTIFDDFKLVIIDEAHHYAAPIFSRSLQKAGANYILGLSATPIRQDGLTRVLHWYMGDTIYRQIVKINRQVIVKVFNYQSNSMLFVEKMMKCQGKMIPNNTTMISNIVKIKSRNDHLVKIINQLRKFPERKILILSHRRQHLDFIKKRIDEDIKNDIEKGVIIEGECNSYYYIGGMTSVERKNAEDMGDLLFGTFHMAEEGLDIDKLNTIILATSKKNIIQAVGRIMRKVLQRGDVRPLIIDLHDNLSIFNGQFKTRMNQYNNNKYQIENYYLKNDKIQSYQEYLKDNAEEENNDYNYIPTYESILDLQKVQELDNNMDNCEIIELDPNDENFYNEEINISLKQDFSEYAF